MVHKAKFEYSPLGKVFNKELDGSDKKRLLKRLKNIEDKNGNQLHAIKDQGEKQQAENKLKMVEKVEIVYL